MDALSITEYIFQGGVDELDFSGTELRIVSRKYQGIIGLNRKKSYQY